jgi:hypothetical protein
MLAGNNTHNDDDINWIDSLMTGRIIYPTDKGYKVTLFYVTARQKGLCSRCYEPMRRDDKDEPIVIKSSRPIRYYHIYCAEKIGII